MSDQQSIKVLHFSSRYEECGVAKYLDHYVKGMEDAPNIVNEYFDVSPYATHHMSEAEIHKMADDLYKQLKDFDVLHVQHEFALYGHDSFRQIVNAAKRAHKKIVITVHTSPNLGTKPAKLKGIGPRSIVQYFREKRHFVYFVRTHIVPFQMADLLLVHNDPTAESLQSFGVPKERIKKILHPVQVFDPPKHPSHRIAEALNKQPGDVIYCTIGFFHRYKGIIEAVKALKFLPPNYKLAILGGMKADSDDVAFYDKVCDLIDTLGVQDRVHITGYVPTDDELNALIRECDVCVYPYNGVYYGQVSSGSVNLAFANGVPAIAYPTASIKELAAVADGALVLCETFAYYELARELKRIDVKKQSELSKAFAEKMAWPIVSKDLVAIYEAVVQE
ncbi:MAG TPA: glycosyltransferase [Patescibacteria group bacterium]|nr:glycosyltransferase [Patescibacteria group bacterium]